MHCRDHRSPVRQYSALTSRLGSYTVGGSLEKAPYCVIIQHLHLLSYFDKLSKKIALTAKAPQLPFQTKTVTSSTLYCIAYC